MSTIDPTISWESNLPRGPLRIAKGGAQLLVYQSPSHDEPDFYVPPNDILSVTVKERSGESADTGSITIDNYKGKYTKASSDYRLGMDDRIVFRALMAGRQRAAGEGPAGVGLPDGWMTVGDWILTSPPTIDSTGPESRIEFDVMDYVWGILRERVVSYNGSDAPIAGERAGQEEVPHLNRLLKRKCPRIQTDQIGRFPTRIDFNARGLTMAEVVERLAGHAAVGRGSCVTYPNGRDLVFSTIESLPRPLQNENGSIDSPLGGDDFIGDIKSSPTDEKVINSVRVDGGIDDENIEQNPNEDFDHYEPVSQTNPLTAQLYVRKSQIPKIQIWTKGPIEADEETGDITSELRVRIQAPNPDGTGPIDIFDTASDITASTPREIAISIDDWTRFLFPQGEDHIVNDIRPWMIIDTTGEAQYEVGVDAESTPLYRVHYSKPIIAVDQNNESLGQYLPHERLIEDRGLMTRRAARERALEAANRNPFPERTIEGQAATERAHNLNVGDVVPFYWPLHQIGLDTADEDDIYEEYLVVSRTVNYENRLLQTSIELQSSGTTTAAITTNRAPTASFTVNPPTPTVNQTVILDASESFDPDGSIVSYEWDLDGDGTVDQTGTIVETTYATAENYSVTLTVTDDGGKTNSLTKTITVTTTSIKGYGVGGYGEGPYGQTTTSAGGGGYGEGSYGEGPYGN